MELEESQRREGLWALQDQRRGEADRLAAAVQDAEATAEASKRRHEQLSAALAAVEEERRQVVKAQDEQQRLADMAATASAAVSATENRLGELREQEARSRSEE